MTKQQESPQFKTKSGRLTRYSLACGYLEQKEFGQFENGNDWATVKLEMDGSCLQVNTYIRKEGHPRWAQGFPESMKELRRMYSAECKRVANIFKGN
jgi:hypothetical protein